MAYRSKGFLGDGNIGVFKLGDSDVKLYLGDMLVYPLEEEWDIVATFNVTDTSNPTKIVNYNPSFSKIEIDGVVQPSVVSAYTFSTTGEHVVKYALVNKTTMGFRPFIDCSALTNIVLPDTITSIDGLTFDGCTSLTNITIPDSVTSLGDSVFYNCTSLTSATIGSGVTSIGNCTFSGCTSLTNITIPDSVTSIGYDVFYNCSGLTSCTIGNGVTSIGNNAFTDCSSLTTCIMGSGLTNISDTSFVDCSSLSSITCNAMSAPSIRNRTFIGVGTNGTLYVPIGSSGYNTWTSSREYYLGYYGWTKVEQ